MPGLFKITCAVQRRWYCLIGRSVIRYDIAYVLISMDIVNLVRRGVGWAREAVVMHMCIRVFSVHFSRHSTQRFRERAV